MSSDIAAAGVQGVLFPSWQAAARTLGAWLELEQESQIQLTGEWFDALSQAWNHMLQADTPDARWDALARLASRQSELTLRRLTELGTHFFNVQAQEADLLHEQWCAVARPFMPGRAR